jgi:hypothetical protein
LSRAAGEFSVSSLIVQVKWRQAPEAAAAGQVNRHDDATVNGLGTGNRCRFFNQRERDFMKHLVAALVVAAFSTVTLAEGTTAATPPAQTAPATASAPASASTSTGKSGTTTKKHKKKKANKSSSTTTGAANASAASPTK